MLSKHPEKCRFPHGHTRSIEVVVSSERLNQQEMVVDFKALKMAVGPYIDRLDHTMSINSKDPLLGSIQETYPESVIVFEDQDPTTEILAKDLFDFIADVLASGFSCKTSSGATYDIPAGTVQLERVRLWETPTSWAEYGH